MKISQLRGIIPCKQCKLVTLEEILSPKSHAELGRSNVLHLRAAHAAVRGSIFILFYFIFFFLFVNYLRALLLDKNRYEFD